MKINIEFEGWGELCDFLAQATATPMAQLRTSFEIGDKVVEEAVQTAKEEKAKKSTPKKEKAQEEAKTETTVEPPHGVDNEDPIDAPAQKVDVVELRGLLAKVNRKTGTNTASQWIQEIAGKAKLTEVDDQEALAQIKAKAEEVLNA